ncbi:MAG: thermonuclease family protein [Nitrososphaerales archaeon]
MKKSYVLVTLLAVVFPYVHAFEPVTVTDVALTASSGKVMIQALVTNNSDLQRNFLYIVQVKDFNGYTVDISWVDVELRPMEMHVMQLPLLVEIQDAYTIQIFVWSNIEDPVPLSYTYNAITFSSNISYPCKGAALCFEGIVTRIVDGDTVDVDGKRIRLALVNTPERGEPGYSEARNFTSALCPLGSTVLVDQDDKQMYDRYGRMVAVVYCDGTLLNAELLSAGHAIILTSFCNVSEFGTEAWAKMFGC